MASDEICRNSAKLGELTATQETMKKELEVLYETWEELSEQI